MVRSPTGASSASSGMAAREGNRTWPPEARRGAPGAGEGSDGSEPARTSAASASGNPSDGDGQAAGGRALPSPAGGAAPVNEKERGALAADATVGSSGSRAARPTAEAGVAGPNARARSAA